VIGNLLQPELVELIEKRDFVQLREILCNFDPPDIAEIFTDLKAGDEAVLLRILPRQTAAEVFEYLSLPEQESLVQALGNEQVAQILNDLAPDDRTALLEELPASVTQKLLNLLSPKEREIASQLLGYPEESIGRRMTPEYVAIQHSWTVDEVLAHLRKVGKERESFNQLYVVDDKGRLVDSVRLKNLVLAEFGTPVSELFDHQPLALHATEDQETAVTAFKKYDRTILPVVDSNDVLVGVITVDDILDVAEQEATEDIQKLGGMEALDAPYLTIKLRSMIKKRAGWLSILFISEMFTATAMQFFEGEIERAAVLALFLPLILSSGGNSGSQATSLIIRAMAVRDVALADWWRVLRRELLAGFSLGCVLASIVLVRILLWPHKEKLYTSHYMLVAATVACSLVCVVLWGSIVGSMLPFLLRRLGFDPAVSSAPFVATLVDVTGIVVYFHIALLVLSGSLLAPSTPDIVRLESEKTATAFQKFLRLDESWAVKRVEFYLKNDKLNLVIEEGEKPGNCEACGGGLEVNGHAKPQHWQYENVFQYPCEIESALPLLKCKKCGKVLQAAPPWEKKAKLLSATPPNTTRICKPLIPEGFLKIA
jgi:magnesium transporter